MNLKSSAEQLPDEEKRLDQWLTLWGESYQMTANEAAAMRQEITGESTVLGDDWWRGFSSSLNGILQGATKTHLPGLAYLKARERTEGIFISQTDPLQSPMYIRWT